MKIYYVKFGSTCVKLNNFLKMLLSVFHYLKYIVKLVHNYWEFLQKPLIGEKGCWVKSL